MLLPGGGAHQLVWPTWALMGYNQAREPFLQGQIRGAGECKM